ncbi:MAG: hypothetical protein AB7U35_14035, partial [Sphingobium sp.]
SKFASPRFILLGILPLAGACSTAVDHPSLAPRAVERFTVAVPETAPAAPTATPAQPANASLQQRVAALAAQARQADLRFRERLSETEQRVETGGSAAPGTETWVQAQAAISSLEMLRAPVSVSLADLDALQIAAAEEGAGTESPVLSALQEVEIIEAAQRASIDALRARIANP